MVSPGDEVKVNVFGMYKQELTEPEDLVEGMIGTVVGGMTYTGGMEAGEIIHSYQDLLSAAVGVNQPDPSVPKAYLKYIIFDKNMKPQQNGHEILSEAALNNWEELTLDIPIEHNGYIYIDACPPKGRSPTT